MRAAISTGIQRISKTRISWLAVAAILCVSISAGAQQNQPQSQSNTTAPAQRKAVPHKAAPAIATPSIKKSVDTDLAWLQDAMKDKEFLAALSDLASKLQKDMRPPVPRTQSPLMARLPDSTVFYVAMPNYGDMAHQALQIFQEEIKDSAPFHNFLQKHKFDEVQPKIENAVEKFYGLSQLLGDEIIVTGSLKGENPNGVLLAEIKRPGVKEFLEKLNQEVFTGKGNQIHILGPQQLATAVDAKDGAPIVLVRTDLLMIGLKAETLREFNTLVDQGGPRFASTALGQRLAQSYQKGTSALVGVDLKRIMALVPTDKPENRKMLEKSGFGDMKYAVAESNLSLGHSSNSGEVIFNGPRHGVASWIAPSGPMGALDFISSRAASAIDVRLKNPAEIFDDLEDMLGPQAFSSLFQMETQLRLNLKRDLLSKLTGEIAIETHYAPSATPDRQATFLQNTPAQVPSVKLILGVSDSQGLQNTLQQLLMMAPLHGGTREQDGVTIHTLNTPGPAGGTEINYFFLDGYLIISTDRDGATEAVEVHRNGKSVAKSSQLQQAQVSTASVVFYQDVAQMFLPLLAQLPPELRQLVPDSATSTAKANVSYITADATSFRMTSNSSMQTDTNMVLIAAAVAIPNLLRSKMAANEAAAAATLRTVNTAEVTYSTVYPAKGYAPSLAALGTPADGKCSGANITPAHACLVDSVLGGASCTPGAWCEKSGYRFSVKSSCMQSNCKNYVATATPVSTNTGSKSFCAVEDAVIRQHIGEPLQSPLTAAECRAWKPLH
jgi:hypothetical protein